MPIRLSGLSSGLDTDAVVKELMTAQRAKVDKITKKKTKLADALKNAESIASENSNVAVKDGQTLIKRYIASIQNKHLSLNHQVLTNKRKQLVLMKVRLQ